MDLMQLGPEKCVMIAAHAYDLRAAKKVYVRPTFGTALELMIV